MLALALAERPERQLAGAGDAIGQRFDLGIDVIAVIAVILRARGIEKTADQQIFIQRIDGKRLIIVSSAFALGEHHIQPVTEKMPHRVFQEIGQQRERQPEARLGHERRQRSVAGHIERLRGALAGGRERG